MLPPVVADLLRARRKAPLEWEFLGSEWPRSVDEQGWDHPEIAHTAGSRWDEFTQSLRAPLPLGRSNEASAGVVDYAAHNTYYCFAYALARAIGTRREVSVLDWGGGLGEYLRLGQELFPEVDFSYVCKEKEPMVELGSALTTDAEFTADGSVALSKRYDLVMASSSLHYEQDWALTLEGLTSASRGWLYVTRQPVVWSATDFVILQRAHRHGYPTEYPGWVLNRGRLLERAEQVGMLLEREMLIAERPLVPGAPEQPEYRGFLFRKVPAP